PHSKTFFFLDKGKRRGLTYETMMEFEKFLNKELKTRHLKLKVVVIPTPRNKLLQDLQDGYGDIAAGNLTITANREKLVDFTNPGMSGVSEIVVTRPGEPELSSVFDLSGREVFVRKSSSYYESLIGLNKTLQYVGKKQVQITPADEYLEDEDLLEMVNAGLVPIIVIDSHKAQFWEKIFKKITLHPKIKLRHEGDIAWAIRKDNPQLKKVINEFVSTIKKGSLTGNILYKRYLEDTGYIKNSLSDKGIAKFNRTIDLFKKYAVKYDFPYLMLMALAYQESGLDQSKRSHVGALGIMQVLPSTAKDKNVGVSKINKIENNIHAGTKYLRFMSDRYFNDDSIDSLNRNLLAMASYNAGPAKINRLRKEAKERGLDPNVWFNNVEVVAARRIGRETVQYVGNIYKYYIAYNYIVKKEKMKEVGKSILKESFK
ncbi:MAG: transporter substrate-binding domain-containing protein, partial [Desulfobulbaceae bacterium]|nr:transporter substrate-binding domain-containing protein [Desulfobulbaceae bacterium]